METVAAEPTRRERKMLETRDAIVRAAESLFVEHGFGETTIEQIADRADIAPRTFFRYFPTKESVLFADAGAKRAALLEALGARPADEHPFVSLVTVVRELAVDVSKDWDSFELRQRISREHASVRDHERTVLECEIGDALAGFVAERLGVDVDTDPRPKLWAGISMATFRVAFHVWLERGKKGSLSAAVERAMDAAAEALGALSAAEAPR